MPKKFFEETETEAEEKMRECCAVGSNYVLKNKGMERELAMTFENIQDRIFMRLINFEQNQRLLENVPYIPFLDLAITFYCLIERSEEAIASFIVTNQIRSDWELDLSKLFKLAMKNTPHLFPAVISTMDEIVEAMLQREMIELQEYYRENPVYVMSNLWEINGAAVLLYENVLKDFADRCQMDFYVLPSSIHEVLLVPCDGRFSEEELRAMVVEVNRTQVPKEEVLSDTVYLYHRKENCFVELKK